MVPGLGWGGVGVGVLVVFLDVVFVVVRNGPVHKSVKSVKFHDKKNHTKFKKVHQNLVKYKKI